MRDLSSARSARSTKADHELALRAEPSASRIARHWAMRVVAAAGIGGNVNQRIEVLTAELVADTVRAGDGERPVRVQLRVGDESVRVAVTGPCPAVPTPEDTTSLALVEVLSTAWGTWPLPDGERTVWFDVETAD